MTLRTLLGHQVNGVVTTGIYCRSGCSGRPKLSNSRLYESHLAAEAAGFRPCLKCRPDRLAPLPISPDAPAVVVRALMLITEGFLDREQEDALGRAVGMSERHLRRLFLDHVGATPAAVARSRRAHFARRMLDETDLPVSDVSAAAGFRSVRQMNRGIKEVFRFTPVELRAKRRDTDRLVIDGGLRLRVPVPPHFSFQPMLGYFAERAIPGVEAVRDGKYMRVTSTCGFPAVIEVSQPAGPQHLEVVAHLPTYNSLIDDVARCRRLFGLDMDLDAARRTLTADPVIGPLVSTSPGLTVPGAWDRFETAVRVIVGQQVSVRGASEIAGRIAKLFGTPVPGLEAFGLDRLFPSAERLAVADLAAAGMPAARARAVQTFAMAVASGEIDLYGYEELDGLLERLKALPGIGPWSANMIAMRVYGHPDAFASGDLGLQRAAGRLAGVERLDAKATEQMAEAWRPWRALAAVYLWRSYGGAQPAV